MAWSTSAGGSPRGASHGSASPRRTGTNWSANGRDRPGAAGARVVRHWASLVRDRRALVSERRLVAADCRQVVPGPRGVRVDLPVTLDRLAVVLATACGVGFVPVAPGTAASAVTVGLLWMIPLSVSGRLVALVLVLTVGTWAAHRAEVVLGGKDPGAIVVDEVAGMTLTVALSPLTPGVLAVGFVAFRVFDILKPPPARWCERLPGGIGVMADDLVAGAYGLIVLTAGGAAVGA